MFGEIINPWFSGLVHQVLGDSLPTEFLVGEYGLWTMGMTYALALILPIVTTFFITFGVLEDSGYLPRLSALSNRLFTAIGLNGEAVLPMVLGLGCVTMATMTTRILDNRRDRVLVTLLLLLAAPCSAQLGSVGRGDGYAGQRVPERHAGPAVALVHCTAIAPQSAVLSAVTQRSTRPARIWPAG
ncbi:MAG: nucleoside recognition domain-containing protein [Candidatus Roseilinea sp.]|uniref:nucleoside recognition domain-containing protein n=1 Tax=Candidatus Roseilinea sp. TaxID=2838777 RepID=UPI00404B53D2